MVSPVTATVLLVSGVIGVVAGIWLLFRKRQLITGSLLLVAGLFLLLLGFVWPAYIVGDSGDTEAPAPEVVMPVPMPTATEMP
jgi:uncharacterized membrane protein